PPPCYNFLHPPTVKGRDALWDDTAAAPVVVGLSIEKREVLTTTLLDAEPDHRYELADDSIWPLLLAIVASGSFIGAIFNGWAVIVGAGLSTIVFGFWFWRGTEPHTLIEGSRAKSHESSA